jgi:chemotaxis receptor (MCP) glutamine deamidase CheD
MMDLHTRVHCPAHCPGILGVIMATVNKSDRKKLVSTQIIGSVVVFHRCDTEAEIGRVDTAMLEGDILQKTLVYGIKQIVSDIVAAADGIDAKVAGMAQAIKKVNLGEWPRREASVGNVDKALEVMAKALGLTVAEVQAKLKS